MGYFAHDALIVTSFWDDDIEAARDAAVDEFGEQVTPITPAAVNGYRSFLVPPDGSKEGWEASRDGDEKRDRLIAKLRKIGGVSFVAVCFGGDFGAERRAEVTAHSGVGPDEEDEFEEINF